MATLRVGAMDLSDNRRYKVYGRAHMSVQPFIYAMALQVVDEGTICYVLKDTPDDEAKSASVQQILVYIEPIEKSLY